MSVIISNKAIKCPLCDTAILEGSFINTYISSYTKQTYKLYRCQNCNLEFWEPLKIIPEFYEDGVLESYATIHSGISKVTNHHKPFLKYFLKLKIRGQLLDVGCGNGGFLNEVQRYGFQVYGIDFDKNSIKIAKEKFGLEHVYRMSIEEFIQDKQSNGKKFDVITLFEVLEHQDNPQGLFWHIKMLLKPNGYIAGSVPNRERPFVKLERHRNKGDYPPHHFLYFSEEVLRSFLVNEGFDNIEFYHIFRPFRDIPAFVEHLFLGGFTKNIKQKLKRYIVKDNDKIKLSLHELSQTSGYTNIMKVLNIVKMLRNIIFLPLSIPVYLYMRTKGYQIYFQAQYMDGQNNNER